MLEKWEAPAMAGALILYGGRNNWVHIGEPQSAAAKTDYPARADLKKGGVKARVMRGDLRRKVEGILRDSMNQDRAPAGSRTRVARPVSRPAEESPADRQPAGSSGLLTGSMSQVAGKTTRQAGSTIQRTGSTSRQAGRAARRTSGTARQTGSTI